MSKHFVLIPTISKDAVNSCLVTAYSEVAPTISLGSAQADDVKTLVDDKNRSLITLALRPMNLHTVGDSAVEKVRRLIKYRGKNSSWLNQQRLHCSGKTEGESCELGFALALLLNQQNLAVNLISTGKLGGVDGKIEIETVNDIPQKLALVLKEREASNLNQASYLFFTPLEYRDAIDGKLRKVADLPEVKVLAELKIQVLPVATLNEVVDKLKLLPRFSRRKLLWAGFGFLVAGLIGLTGYQLQQPILLEFAEGQSGFGQKPFLVCMNNDESQVNYHPIKRDGSVNVVYELAKNSEWNVLLSWRVIVPPLQGLNPISFIKYHYYLVNVDEQMNLRIREDEVKTKLWEKSWGLEEPAQPEKNLLMLLATRKRLNLSDFQEKFKQHFPQNSGGNLTAVENYLSEQAAGALPFQYQVKLQEDFCDK